MYDCLINQCRYEKYEIRFSHGDETPVRILKIFKNTIVNNPYNDSVFQVHLYKDERKCDMF